MTAGRREEPGTLRLGIGYERHNSDIGEAGVGHQPPQVFVSEAEPHVAHLLPVALAFVRQHVDQQKAAARLEDARHFLQRHGRIRHVMEHQHQRGDVEPRIVDRQRLELAAAEIDIVGGADARARRLQHLRRGVDRDHPRDKRRQRRTDVTGSTAKVADDPARIGERRQRREMKTVAEQIVAEAIPLAGRRGEKLLRPGPPLGQDALQALLILNRLGRGADLLAHEQPEPPCGGLEGVVVRCAVSVRPRDSCPLQSCRLRLRSLAGHRIEVTGAFPSSRDPLAVRQRLQMTADRRLRQLHHGTQLRDRHLLPFEEKQNAVPGGIRESGQVFENWVAHLIRLSGWSANNAAGWNRCQVRMAPGDGSAARRKREPVGR